MNITLDSVTITTGMVWEERYAYSPVQHNVRRTLGGVAVVEYGSLSGGAPITLASLEDQGWVTKEQLDALQILADDPGAVYTLGLGSDSYTVMFRHQDNPALEFSPLIPRTGPITGDYFVGRIKLMVA